MSVTNPVNKITRWSVVGMEGMWTKMWDPPTTSPATTDELPAIAPVEAAGLIRPNPVPEVMFALGLQSKPKKANVAEFDLLHGLSIPTWDGVKKLNFFVIGDPANPSAAGGTYPGPTLRMPRSVIFKADTSGKGPPPHTIHWHGIEPTPLNDGVGHCSMEIGHYTYQWQPNFMGFYFAHCHRNTMQHFEYGLYFAMIFEAPDAYFGSIASTNADGTVVLKDLAQFPIGGGRDGKRRTACNLDDPLTGLPKFTKFPGFNRNPVATPDPGPAPTDTQVWFPTDPHAMTVPIDVEVLLAFDDRDSVWSDLAPSAFTTFPKHGSMPGINDEFALNPGTNGFAAFNDYTADYWFVTGVPVPAHKGGIASIPANIVIPAALNSGISGTQVSVNAGVNQTICVRVICAAYNTLRVTFPVDVVVVAWDGRALGVAPFGFNNSYLVTAGTPITTQVARRFEVLINENTPIASNIITEFINNKSQTPGDIGEEVMVTALVPFNIGVVPPVGGTIKINVTPAFPEGQATTNTTAATLTLTTDAGIGAQMQFSKDGVTYTRFEPFAGTRVVSHTPGDGLKTISVKFKNALGQVTIPISASIALDTTKPIGTIAFTTPNPTTSATGVLALTCSDAGGMVHDMQFSTNNGVSFFPMEMFAATRTVKLVKGPNTLTVRFRDQVGNFSIPISASITRL